MIRHFSAGGVVIKKQGGFLKFLLCKSSLPSSNPNGNWGFPKGWLDDASDGQPGPMTLGQVRATPEQVRQAALREVREEGGVEAKIIERLGQVQYVYTDNNHDKIFKTIIFFLMEYQSDVPGGFGFETAEILWASEEEALQILKRRKGEGDLIRQAAHLHP